MRAPGMISLAGVYDALSARLLELSGLSAAYVSGYCVSASLLGMPDVGYLTLPEIVATRRADCRADPPAGDL